MKKIVATLAIIVGLTAAVPANAQWGWGGGWYGPGYGYGYGGWGYGGYGYGYGYGGYGAAMGVAAGAALVGGVIGGAIASQQYAAPVYAYPQQPRRVRQQVIIKNSPGAQVYEENDFGW